MSIACRSQKSRCWRAESGSGSGMGSGGLRNTVEDNSCDALELFVNRNARRQVLPTNVDFIVGKAARGPIFSRDRRLERYGDGVEQPASGGRSEFAIMLKNNQLTGTHFAARSRAVMVEHLQERLPKQLQIFAVCIKIGLRSE